MYRLNSFCYTFFTHQCYVMLFCLCSGIREDRSRGGRSTYDGASAFLHRRFKRCSESSDYQPNPTSYYPPFGKRMKTNEPLSPETQPPVRNPVVPDLLKVFIRVCAHFFNYSFADGTIYSPSRVTVGGRLLSISWDEWWNIDKIALESCSLRFWQTAPHQSKCLCVCSWQ